MKVASNQIGSRHGNGGAAQNHADTGNRLRSDLGDPFATILSGRNALATASQALESSPASGVGAPSAKEFAAVGLFRAGIDVRSEAVDLGVAALDTRIGLQVDAPHSASAIASKCGPACETGLAAFQAASLQDPLQIAIKAKSDTLIPSRLSSAFASALQHMPAGEASVETSVTALAELSTAPKLVGHLEADRGTRTPGASRRTAESADPGRFALLVAEEADKASVYLRVAGLNLTETRELDRRVRDELGRRRFGLAEIKINGRRAPARPEK